MRKIFCCIIIMILLIVNVTYVFADSANEFAAFYGAEQGTDYWNAGLSSAPKYNDVLKFQTYFSSIFGWTNRKTSFYGQKSDIKGSWDSNETDILYWSGHGLDDGILSYYDGTSYVSYLDSNFYGYNTVGDDIMFWDSYNGYTTNSNWDSDMEWAIFAACNQFSTPELCRSWGRTLLGYPHRAHSAWGYSDDHTGSGSAPTGPTDTDIVLDFIGHANSGNSVKYSWLQANRDNGKRNWAGVSHYSNRYDRLWGEGITYDSTSTAAYPDIRLYDEDLSDPVYDSGWPVDPANISYLDKVNILDNTLLSNVLNNQSFINTKNETKHLSKKINSKDDSTEKHSIAYTITFGKKINDLPVSVFNGDKIDVIIDSNGISSICKKWSNDVECEKGKDKNILSIEETLDKLGNNVTSITSNDTLNIENIALVYRDEKSHDNNSISNLLPVWEMHTSDDTIIQLNAYTGEIFKEIPE
ncbi:MAG: hypothetical protein ABF289_05415 [Clostridiales bacterium]